jgi:hypothetical protein
LQHGQNAVAFRSPVRKFIRNATNKTFLAKDGTWTIDLDSAVEFQNDDEAGKTRDTCNLKGWELYFCVGEKPTNLDFVLPLGRLS